MTRLDAAGAAITRRVGTMSCAILFAVLALVSLPGAIATHNAVVIVGWTAQTFLQLVLLPIIIVGQTAQGASTERLIRETHDAVLAHFGALHQAVGSDLDGIPS